MLHQSLEKTAKIILLTQSVKKSGNSISGSIRVGWNQIMLESWIQDEWSWSPPKHSWNANPHFLCRPCNPVYTIYQHQRKHLNISWQDLMCWDLRNYSSHLVQTLNLCGLNKSFSLRCEMTARNKSYFTAQSMNFAKNKIFWSQDIPRKIEM